MKKLEEIHHNITSSLERHRYKEALRHAMSAAQYGNQLLQAATPWKYLKDSDSTEAAESFARLSFGWRISRRFDLSQLEAKLQNGLLHLYAPLADEAKPKAVTIK